MSGFEGMLFYTSSSVEGFHCDGQTPHLTRLLVSFQTRIVPSRLDVANSFMRGQADMPVIRSTWSSFGSWS